MGCFCPACLCTLSWLSYLIRSHSRRSMISRPGIRRCRVSREKSLHGHRQQISGRQQRTNQQHDRPQPREYSHIRLQCPLCQIPLADEAPRRRNPHQCKRKQQITPQHLRHPLPDPHQFLHPCIIEIIDEYPRCQEQTAFHHRMHRHMEHGPRKPIRRQQRQPEHNIRHLAHRGVRQPFLEDPLPVGQHGTHEHRQQRQRHPRLLHPGPPEKIRPHDIEDHPHHRQHAGFHDDAGQYRGSRGGSYRVGRGKPGVQRRHAGLCPKAQQRGEHSNQQNALMALYSRHIQRPARRKCQRMAVPVQEKDGEQPPIRAAQGIEQILQRRHHRLPFPVVEHQRHGDQRGQLIEQIHGHQIPRKIKGHKHTIQHQVKSEIPFLLPLMPHVDKGEQRRQYPYDADHRHEQPAHRIDAEVHRYRIQQREQHRFPVPCPGRRQRQGHGNPKHRAHIGAEPRRYAIFPFRPGSGIPRVRDRLFPESRDQQYGTAYHWQRYRNQ